MPSAEVCVFAPSKMQISLEFCLIISIFLLKTLIVGRR